jgi:hypothetical protein
MTNNINMKKQEMQNQLLDPLLELKINQPLQQQYKPAMPEIYPSPYIPIQNPYFPYGPNPMVPWQFTPNNVPVIKKYNISLGNGNGDITRIANLFEDILPSVNNIPANTFNTLNERLIMHNYIRSVFIKNSDGEDVLINGGPNNTSSELINLLGHIKLLEINPYHSSDSTNNFMKTLPPNFMMYRSCYPIRMGNNNNIECSATSIGMNIRIYLLNQFDISYKNNKEVHLKSNVRRELWYYEFIRNEIIKKKLSPNFITIHSWYLTENTGIDFGKQRKLTIYKTKYYNILAKQFSEDKYTEIKNFIMRFDIDNKDERDYKYDLAKYNKYLRYCKLTGNNNAIVKYKFNSPDNDTEIIDHLKDSFSTKKCMVILTEAPNQLLVDWGSRTYVNTNGPINKMIQTGYHEPKVWQSVYFQILMAMILMFDKGIYFTDFQIHNIYIKDMKQSENSLGIWKYIYDGIEYFVPNYGYLVLIDSNFKQPEYSSDMIYNKLIYNIDGLIYNEKCDNNKKLEIHDKCIESMINIFNYTDDKITTDPDFKHKLDQIHEELIKIKKLTGSELEPELENKKISMKNLPLFFITGAGFNFVHNRIGSFLTEDELKKINIDTLDVGTFKRNIKKKRICVYKNVPIYCFVLFISTVETADGVETADVVENSELMVNILQSDTPFHMIEKPTNNELTLTPVNVNLLYEYPGYLEQYYTPGTNLSILETYTIS